jgi:hypothetical protein
MSVARSPLGTKTSRAGPTLSLGFGSLLGSAADSRCPWTKPRDEPSRKWLYNYEAYWLTLLLQIGLVDDYALGEAPGRVVQTAIDEVNERRRAGGWRRRKRRTD